MKKILVYLTKNGAGFIKKIKEKKVLFGLGEYGVFESSVYVPGHSFPVAKHPANSATENSDDLLVRSYEVFYGFC